VWQSEAPEQASLWLAVKGRPSANFPALQAWVAPIIAQLVNVLAGGVSMCYIENQVDTIFIRQVQQ
jgi:hypothetical protein